MKFSRFMSKILAGIFIINISLYTATAFGKTNTNNFINSNSSSNDNGPIITTLTVPPEPVSKQKQFLALWPGLNTNTVLQPVLSWSAPGNWEISSWNCCDKRPYSSPKYKAEAGDAILGIMMPQCAVGEQACTRWKITTINLNTQKSTTLDTTFNTTGIKLLSPAFFETQSLSSCDELPANSEVTFSTLAFTADLKEVSRVWNKGVDANDGKRAIPYTDCSWTQEVAPPRYRLGYNSGAQAQPGFDITSSDNTIRLSAGETHDTRIGLSARYGFKGVATLYTYGIPEGISAEFDDKRIDDTGLTRVLTLTAGENVKPGVYPLAAYGLSPRYSAAAPILLIVE